MAITFKDVVREYVVANQDSPEQLVDLLMMSRAEQVAVIRAYARAKATQKRAEKDGLQAKVDEAAVRLLAEAAELEAI